jgi:diguanylate cyclase (GGDEF)-like protein
VRRNTDFSLTALTLPSLSWWFGVVAGWALLGTALGEVVTTPAIMMAGPLVMTGVLLVVLELLPLVQGRGHDPNGVVMSTPFTFAIMAIWGVWPAVIMVAFASVASDLRAHKAWWKVAFNPAQYAVSVFCGFLVMRCAGVTPTLAHPLPDFYVRDMTWTVGVWVVYYVVNLVLVSAVLAFRDSFRRLIVADITHVTILTFAVFALTPLIVVVAQTSSDFLPLLLVPLLLLYSTAQMSLRREHEAGHDALTGLPNRMSLQFALTDAIEQHQRDERPFGLILIDLDDFKRVNDTLGHMVGDELLRKFAERVKESARPTDCVARLGGDEFAVLVFDADESDMRRAAERIHQSIADPIELSGLALDLQLSLGVALCPRHGTNAHLLLQRADVAMYVAKTNRTKIEVYSSDRDDNSTDRLNMLSELRQALDDDSVELHYQPKVSAATSALLGMEALIRWRHPTRGMIMPDEFIPLAERSGIMPLITRRVILLALQQIAQWRTLGLNVPVAVNVAPTDLVDDRLVDIISRALHEFDVPAGMLQLEITERVIASDVDDSHAVLAALRTLGVTVSLDDFGTGYSSLLRLNLLPVDEIKIDRGFVASLSNGDRAAGIVRALINLAHELAVPVIAEGVESAEALEQLRRLGCDGVQGWHIAGSMVSEQATQWLLRRVAQDQLRTAMAAPDAVAAISQQSLAGAR